MSCMFCNEVVDALGGELMIVSFPIGDVCEGCFFENNRHIFCLHLINNAGVIL